MLKKSTASSGSIVIKWAGDALDVDIRDGALEEVLRQIADENGITFRFPLSAGEDEVMVRGSNLKIEESLRKILKDYNSIFIYVEEGDEPGECAQSRLKEVRIYPRFSKSKEKETFVTISKGAKRNVTDKRKIVEKESLKQKKENTVETLSLELKSRDTRVRLEAVKELAKINSTAAIVPLYSALKDRNPDVKNEAAKALEQIGEDLKEGYKNSDAAENLREEYKNSDTAENDKEPLPPEEEREKSTLTLIAGTGDTASVNLVNEVPVVAVQFKLNGAKLADVRTTSRTEGFSPQYNEKNGTVVLISLSGDMIQPGSGPIAEIVSSNTDSTSLSPDYVVGDLGGK